MTDQLTLTQVDYGAAVAAQGSPSMDVDVAAGGVLVANVPVTVAADTVTITTADATQDRQDAVVADAAGVISVIAGDVNDGANVQPPDTTGYTLLSYVYVYSQAHPDYTGTITSDVVLDARDFALRHVSPYRISGRWYGQQTNFGSQAGWSDNDLYGIPFFTGKEFDIQAIAALAKTGGTAGSVGRLGIYRDDGAGTLSLLVDAGTIALDTTTPTPPTVAETLTPGWWWFVIAFQGLGVTKPAMYTSQLTAASNPVGADTLAHVAQGFYGILLKTGVSGALPSALGTSDLGVFQNPPGVWVQAT